MYGTANPLRKYEEVHEALAASLAPAADAAVNQRLEMLRRTRAIDDMDIVHLWKKVREQRRLTAITAEGRQ